MAFFIFLDHGWPMATTDTGRHRYEHLPLAGRFERVEDFRRAFEELNSAAIQRAVEMRRTIAADEISAAVMVAVREVSAR